MEKCDKGAKKNSRVVCPNFALDAHEKICDTGAAGKTEVVRITLGGSEPEVKKIAREALEPSAGNLFFLIERATEIA
jgi:hypothetical protein